MQEREVEELVAENIEVPRLVHQSVHDGLIRLLLLECPEYSVPDTQPAAVVGVQAVPVSSVVNPVVGGRVEEEAQGPQVSYQLSVQQELVEEIELGVDQHLWCRYHQGQGEVEPVGHPAQPLQHGLPRKEGVSCEVLEYEDVRVR